MREKELFWVDDAHTFMHQKGWKRPITHPSFFLDAKLKWMDQNNIDHEVIITLSQLYANGLSEADASDVIRFQNDFNAGVQAQYPSKFTCGFVVTPTYMGAALKEVQRCVDDLHLSVLCLPTHYVTTSGQWRSIAHPDVEPLFALADAYGLAVEIHPYDGQKFIQLEDNLWRFHLVWMCAQTADAYHYFSLLDFPAKYPNIRTCFAHGNQFGQVNIGRRLRGYRGRPDLFPGCVDPGKSLGAKNVFYDTLVHDVDSLQLLIKRQGVSQVLAGLDDPYPLGEMESEDGCYPGQVIDLAVEEAILTSADRDNIWSTNVLRWLNKEQIL